LSAVDGLYTVDTDAHGTKSTNASDCYQPAAATAATSSSTTYVFYILLLARTLQAVSDPYVS